MSRHQQSFRIVLLCVFSFSLFFHSAGQSEELWFGTYTSEEGKVLQGRYKIIQKGRALAKIILEPYGKAPMELKILENDTIQRFVKVSWPGNPAQIGTLIQYSDGYYAGNFEQSTKVLPMVIKKFNFQDAQLQGNWFEPSQVEVDIIDQAMNFLSTSESWSKINNRICDSNESYSLFCALYQSSLEVDGAYRHLRPAVRFVREAIKEKYPKKYDHVLVDFNAAEEIDLKDVHEILKTAKVNLQGAMK